MDEIDQKIVEILKKDGGIPLSKVADMIGIPRPTAYLRFNKMVDEGIIKGFNLVMGKQYQGQQKAAVLTIKNYLLSDMGPRAVKKVGERLSKRSEVIFAVRISKNSIFVLWEGDSFTPREYDDVVAIEEIDPEVYKDS